MRVVDHYLNCDDKIYEHASGPVFTSGGILHCANRRIEASGSVHYWHFSHGILRATLKPNNTYKVWHISASNVKEVSVADDVQFVSWPCFVRDTRPYFFGVSSWALEGSSITYFNVQEIGIDGHHAKILCKSTSKGINCSTKRNHYHLGDDDDPRIVQLDHDLNVLWQIDEPTLREYGKVDKDDPRAEKYEKRCAVRNIQVFGDTLYYMYNFSMIIALDAHTGAFKRRFSRFPADHHSKYMNPLNGVECRLMRDIDALHAGRYIEELHAFVIVRQEHLIEIDYESLTARARPIHVHHLWKNSMATTDPVVTMIGKDRIAVHAQMSKDVAILDYHTLEVLDFLRLDEEDPSGYLRGSLYHDGKLYVLSTAPSSAVKGCTLYEVEVDRETSS